MTKPPGSDGKQHAGWYARAPRHQRQWGLLVEDEFKTDAAVLVQDAYRSLIATLFYLAASATHDVVISGREHISGHHPCLYLSNHKRDFDSVIVAGTAYMARGFGHPNTRLIYAIREDAMWPGFLSYLQLPGFLGRLAAGFSVRGPMFLLKGYPIGYVRRRPDMPRIKRQLRRFASLLDQGRDVYWTPEGALGLDGRLGPFRAGFYRLIQQSQAPLRVVPVAVFYDFMTAGRQRCFIRIGPEWRVDRSSDRQSLERQARQSILREMTVNIGHLAAAVLRELPEDAQLGEADLGERLLSHGRRLHRQGLALDARLRGLRSFQRRLRQFLAYAESSGILRHQEGLWSTAAGLQHPDMQYALSELSEADELHG